eukprot:g4618.t1
MPFIVTGQRAKEASPKVLPSGSFSSAAVVGQLVLLVFEGAITARQIQFLSHQSRIASRIELYVDDKPDERTDLLIRKYFQEDDVESRGALQYYYEKNRNQFRRLGYLSLDSNERSQFQARELKSVYIDHKARFLRIRLHKCHLNKFNLTNQVSVIAINVLGEKLPDTRPALAQQGRAADIPHAGGAHVLAHPADAAAPAATAGPPIGSGIAAAPASQDEYARFDPKIAEKLRALGKAKDHAVEVEDYNDAKRYKDMITKLKQVAARITECELQKKKAVEQEDYDVAKSLKSEIDALYRAAIEGRDVGGMLGVGGSGGGAPGAEGTIMHDPQGTGGGGVGGAIVGGGGALGGTNYEGSHQQNNYSGSSSASGSTYGRGGGAAPTAGSYGGGDQFPGSSSGNDLQQRDMSSYAAGQHVLPDNSYADPADHVVNKHSGIPGRALPANNEEVAVGGGAGAYAIPGGAGGSSGAPPYNRTRGGGDGGALAMGGGNAQRTPRGSNSSPSAPSAAYNAGKKSYPGSANMAGIGPDSDPNSIKGMHLFNAPDVGGGHQNVGGGGAPDAFGGGPHPEEGAADGQSQQELPEPEPVSASFAKEVQPLLSALHDEHLVCCLYSKQRVLREHGLTRLNEELANGDHDDLLLGEDLAAIRDFFGGLVALLKRTSAEKNVQIFLLSMNLAQTVCTKVALAGEEEGFRLKKADLQPQLDGYVPMLVERLGDTNPRCAQAAGDTILSFALCPNVNCHFISQFLMKPIVSKSKKVFPQKVYCNRIKLLSILMQEGGSELHDALYQQLLQIVFGWYTNPNHEVRQAIVELVGVIYGKTDFAFVEPYLTNLRPAQREVFETELHRVGGEDFLVERQHLEGLKGKGASSASGGAAADGRVSGQGGMSAGGTASNNRTSKEKPSGPGGAAKSGGGAKGGSAASAARDQTISDATIEIGGAVSPSSKVTTKEAPVAPTSSGPGAGQEGVTTDGGEVVVVNSEQHVEGQHAEADQSTLTDPILCSDVAPPPGGANKQAGATSQAAAGPGEATGAGGSDGGEAKDNIEAFQCQFCRLKDPKFTAEGLDLHYWRDCPLLMECKFCTQIIEISGLRSHYLEECEQFPMSIIYEQTPDGTPPVLPPPGACPLCLEQVSEGDEPIWLEHLTNCPENPRKYGAES